MRMMTRTHTSASLALFMLLVGLGGLFGGAGAAHAEPLEADGAPEVRRYALVVANNGSVDEGVAPLRFADDDGARFYELFDALVDDAWLLTTLDADSQRVFPALARETTPATRQNLRERVEALSATLKADREAGVESEVYLVFTGHGNVDESGEGYLSLADGKFARSDLYREVIRPLDADYTHLIIDACHAYFMVRSRGGQPGDGGGGWADDRSGQTLDDEFGAFLRGQAPGEASMPTVGVILSTAGAAEVHEWSALRSGVFSHQLRSGLLGGADANGDGAVDYRELEAYLVAANAAVTNPRARIRVFAEPPAQDRGRSVVELDAFRGATTLHIPAGVGGRYQVEDARGLRYADLNVDPTAASRLTLLREPVGGRAYYVRTPQAQAEVATDVAEVRSVELAFVETGEQARGSVEEEYRTNLFATPFGPSFVAGYTAARDLPEASVRRPASPPSAPSGSLRVEGSVEYGLGPALLDEAGGLQHQLAGFFGGRHADGWAAGLFLGYGFSPETAFTTHRFAVGLEGSWRALEMGRLSLTPRLRLGQQALVLVGDAGGDTADPLGLRTELALVAGWQLDPALRLDLTLGVDGNLVSRVEIESGQAASAEQFLVHPHVGLGLRF